MAECIELTYDGKKYELTYTRESVKRMENAGFDIQAFVSGTKPGTMNPLLFAGAFYARNRKVKGKLIEEIYDHLDGKTDLIVKLAEMYSETLDTLTDSAAAEDDGKKVSWKAV